MKLLRRGPIRPGAASESECLTQPPVRHSVSFSAAYRRFVLLARSSWAPIALIDVVFNIAPSMAIYRFEIGSDFNAPAWRYSFAEIVGLLINCAYSVLVAKICVFSSVSDATRSNTTLINFIRYVVFRLAVEWLRTIGLMVGIFDPRNVQSREGAVGGVIGMVTLLWRLGAVGAFGLFLPALFESQTFWATLRTSYDYARGARLTLLVLYVVFCVADVIFMPLISFAHVTAPLSAALPASMGVTFEYGLAKTFSSIFESMWIVTLCSYYLEARDSIPTRENQKLSMIFD
jgi:hypothetical protein